MADQRNTGSGYGRMARAGRPQDWGMIPWFLGIVAVLFLGYIMFSASPDAPNTTKSSEYQSRPVAPPATQPSTPSRN